MRPLLVVYINLEQVEGRVKSLSDRVDKIQNDISDIKELIMDKVLFMDSLLISNLPQTNHQPPLPQPLPEALSQPLPQPLPISMDTSSITPQQIVASSETQGTLKSPEVVLAKISKFTQRMQII